MADSRSLILSDLVAEYDFVVDDLSVWEIVNPSSDEEEGNSDDDFSLSADEAEVEVVAVAVAESEESAAGAVKDEAPMEVGSPSSDLSMEEYLSAQVDQLVDEGDGDGDGDGNGNGNGNGSGVASVIITAVDCNGGDGVDDDSYAYNYYRDHTFYDSYDKYSEISDAWDSGNLGRNKHKNSGKKASSKMNKAKKLPCRYTKRCVYGKDGFGGQFTYLQPR